MANEYIPFRLQALSRTFIRFFVSPLQDIGEALREFLTSLLKGLPVQLWPVALGGVAIFFFLFLFMYFGYRVRLPFWLLSIEPGQREDNSSLHLALQELAKEVCFDPAPSQCYCLSIWIHVIANLTTSKATLWYVCYQTSFHRYPLLSLTSLLKLQGLWGWNFAWTIQPVVIPKIAHNSNPI